MAGAEFAANLPAKNNNNNNNNSNNNSNNSELHAKRSRIVRAVLRHATNGQNSDNDWSRCHEGRETRKGHFKYV